MTNRQGPLVSSSDDGGRETTETREITKSDRGFRYLPPLPVARGGTVKVHQSSAAVCEDDEVQSGYIWLTVHDVAHSRTGPVEASAHMSHEQARELAARLIALVDAIEAES